MELNSAAQPALPCEKWTVAQLKDYLRQRGVPHSGYVKSKLVNLDGFDSFVTKLTDHFTDARRENIKNHTKAQSKCSLWWKQRIGALTSSTLHLAAHYTRDSHDNYVADRIMGQCKFMGNTATEYGKKSEPVVRKLYVQKMKDKHRKLKVNETGLIISERNPILRVSPDGIVKCECCGTGLIEIKCPYSAETNSFSGEELARGGKYHVVLGDDGKVHLKKSSP